MDNILSDYYAAQKWLYSLITDPKGERFKVEKSAETIRTELQAAIPRLADFLDSAGNPHHQFKSVHIAGTSGKGSVTVMIAALLSAHGFKTADHTSPFLQIPNEKLRLDGQMISPAQFAELIWEFRRLYEAWGKRLAYIEAWSALTMLWVAAQQPDWGIIETGMGGRYDPSNVLDSELAVITNVDFDHMKSLGNTLSEIAYHKAGIIKPNGRVVTAATKPEVLAVILREARQKNAEVQRVDYTIHDDGTLTVRGRLRIYERLALPLVGRYQLLNAATAITAVDWLIEDFTAESTEDAEKEDREGQASSSLSFPRTRESIKAFANLCNIGRFEILQQNPTVIIDGAHNPHKVAALVRSVQSAYPERRITIQMGMIANKDSKAVVEALLPIASDFIFSEPDVFGKLPQSAEDLAKTLQQLSTDRPFALHKRVKDGIEQWLKQAGADDLLLITGSIYLIGEARGRWFPVDEILQSLS